MVRPIIMQVVNRRPKKATQKPKQVVNVKVEDKRKIGAGKQPLVTKVTTKPKGILKKPKVQVVVAESPKKKRAVGFGAGTDFTAKRVMEKRRRRLGPPQVDLFPSGGGHQPGIFDWKRKAKADQALREARQGALELLKHMDDDEHSVPLRQLKGFRGVQLGGNEIEDLSDLLRRDAPPSQVS